MKMIKFWLLLISLMIILPAAVASDDNNEKSSLLSDKICTPYATFSTVGNRYKVFNNVGNHPTTTQCISLMTNRYDQTLSGFILSQSHDETTTPTFPSIVCGRHPWDNSSAGNCLRSPIALAEIPSSLTSRFTINTEQVEIKTCKGNTILDIWILPQGVPVGAPIGGTELLIWFNDFGGMVPGGEEQEGPQAYLTEIVTNADKSTTEIHVPYRSFYGPHWGGGEGWTYVALVRQEPAPMGASVKLKEAIDHCVSLGWCDANHQLTAIEAGFEVYRGCEGAILRNFSVNR